MNGFPDTRLVAWALVVGAVVAVPDWGWSQALGPSAWQRHQRQAAAALADLAQTASMPSDAADAADVPELPLVFETFFRPVGDRGLEFSDHLLALQGRRVRLTGYLLREPQRSVGLAVLVPRPLRIEMGSGERADLPPTAVHLHLSTASARGLVPYRPGLVTVVGTLMIGPAEESDLRTSVVRLLLDEAESTSLVGSSVP